MNDTQPTGEWTADRVKRYYFGGGGDEALSEKVRILEDSVNDFTQSNGALTTEVLQLREQLAAELEKVAYLELQRDALLKITWLDLPSDPDESTAKWQELFTKGWVRRNE